MREDLHAATGAIGQRDRTTVDRGSDFHDRPARWIDQPKQNSFWITLAFDGRCFMDGDLRAHATPVIDDLESTAPQHG